MRPGALGTLRRTVVALAALGWAWQALAQAGPLVIESDPTDAAPSGGGGAEQRSAVERAAKRGVLDMRARSVTVQGRWMAGLAAPLERCALLTPQSISAAMNAVRQAVTAPDAVLRAVGDAALIEVFWVDVDFADPRPAGGADCDGAPTVDVTLRPLHLRVATENIGENVLPLARTALGTAYPQVPAALLALNPGVVVERDRAAGTVVGVSLRAPLAAAAPGLEAHAHASKSLDASFHDSAAGLRWQGRRADARLFETRLRLDAASSRQPLGEAVDLRQTTELGAGIGVRLAPTSRLWLDTGWQSRRDELQASGQAATRRDSHLWTNRLLLDSLQAAGLNYTRAALWHARDTTTRLVAAVGMAHELRLAPGRLVGIEASVAAGHAGAGTPAEQRFRAGPPAAQFLYDGTAAPALIAMPDGPVLRSVGRSQGQLGTGAAARGGTRFASASLNIALPVARWYRPLIPDETTDLQIDDTQPPLTLKQVLLRQVDVTGPSMLAADLMRQGLSASDAQARAQEALAPLRPAVRYLVEDAPLVALRPLFMLDVARLADSDANARWVAVGLGAQLQLATARFEAGYLRTVSGPVPDGGRGGLLLRMTFQTLF